MATTEWHELDQPGRLEACLRASVREVYGLAGLLCGPDRPAAEQLVLGVFGSLAESVAGGRTSSVSLGALRGAVRERWLDRGRLVLLAQASTFDDERSVAPATTIADLSEVERAVVVLRHVNRMPIEVLADKIGSDPAIIERIDDAALTRLGVVDRRSTAWLRERLGSSAIAEAGFVDRAVATLAETPQPPVEVVTDATPPVVPSGAEPAAERPPGDRADRAGSGRRPVVVGGLLAVVAVAGLAGGWWLAGDDGTAGERTATDASGDEDGADNRGSGSAVDPSSTTTVATTTTVALAAERFDPPCVDQPPIESFPPTLDEVALDTFAALAPQPALVVTLPAAVTATGSAEPTADVVRVPGGVVVTVRPNDAAPFAGSIVARIDADGPVRWVRCFDEPVFVRGQSGAPLADSLALLQGGAWYALELLDGSVGATVVEPPPAPLAPFGDPGTTPVWPDPTLAQPSGEGFVIAATTDTALVLACVAADPAGDRGCSATQLRAYSMIDNRLLWQRDGVDDVATVRNGLAVIRYTAPDADPAWYLVNAVDGSAIDGQAWADAAFTTDCCGVAAYSWLTIHGGVVAHVDAATLSVWYPASAALDVPVDIAL